MILAIDTCEHLCSAALTATDGAPIGRFQDDITRGHAEHLLPRLDQLFADHKLDYSDVSRLAVTTGPGSFTGVRVGLSVARGLGFANNIPVIGLSALMVLAASAQANQSLNAGTIVHATMLGRGGQAFHQVFELSDSGLPAPLTDAAPRFADEIQTHIDTHGGYIVGSGVKVIDNIDGALTLADLRVDPFHLATLSAQLKSADYPAAPMYLREADAAVARPIFPTS